jgi:hypothetical protein
VDIDRFEKLQAWNRKVELIKKGHSAPEPAEEPVVSIKEEEIDSDEMEKYYAKRKAYLISQMFKPIEEVEVEESLNRLDSLISDEGLPEDVEDKKLELGGNQ